MPYITREDGERFVIPSYRDVLNAKQTSLLKKDILLLSKSYGDYITLQRKSPLEYEVAFSPDTGYLLGETIWHQFKKPSDMIYCEVVPNTTEAILVIVKNSSVYLDGSFPLDSIPEELIIFLTQQNNFEIYLYGDAPISEKPVDGKFSFEPTSVKSFTVLEKPVFATLPLLKIYQLQLVEPVLKAHGIGVFPARQLLTTVVVVFLLWLAWSYLSTPKKEVVVANQVNPYALFNSALASPYPDQEVQQLQIIFKKLFTMPGWIANHVDYAKGTALITVHSIGGKIENLFQWAKENGMTVSFKQTGVYLSTNTKVKRRPLPLHIYPIKQVIGIFIDKLSAVYPGNHMKLSEFNIKGAFTDVTLTITADDISPDIFVLIGNQFKDLPFVLQEVKMDIDNGSLTGSITIDALGN